MRLLPRWERVCSALTCRRGATTAVLHEGCRWTASQLRHGWWYVCVGPEQRILEYQGVVLHGMGQGDSSAGLAGPVCVWARATCGDVHDGEGWITPDNGVPTLRKEWLLPANTTTALIRDYLALVAMHCWPRHDSTLTSGGDWTPATTTTRRSADTTTDHDEGQHRAGDEWSIEASLRPLALQNQGINGTWLHVSGRSCETSGVADTTRQLLVPTWRVMAAVPGSVPVERSGILIYYIDCDGLRAVRSGWRVGSGTPV